MTRVWTSLIMLQLGLIFFAPAVVAATGTEMGAVERAQGTAVDQAHGVATKDSVDPTQEWQLGFESGVLWKFTGEATPLHYVVVPQLLTVRSPSVSRREFAGGTLVLRSRFSLLLEPIVRGPEKYYVGFSAAGCLEWWDASRTTAVFFSSGGGAGVMHSRGHVVSGGQGQDLNFNWLIYGGARRQVRPGLDASVGVYFQHVSNTGLDRVNPGLNAIGPMVGLGWRF